MKNIINDHIIPIFVFICVITLLIICVLLIGKACDDDRDAFLKKIQDSYECYDGYVWHKHPSGFKTLSNPAIRCMGKE